MSVVNNSLLLGDDGYVIDRSLRFRSSASAYLNRTPASAGNRRTWTWSGWHKRGALQNAWLLGADDGTLYSQIQLLGDYLRFGHVPNTGGTVYGWRTQAVFRDPSAWYHIVFAIDTTQATAANRIRIYVNGVEQTSLVDATGYGAIPQNTDTFINAALSHMVGRFIRGANNQIDGYLTEINFIDGQALTPSSFGETNALTGVWQPKKYAGTYGTNGFYLDFKDPTSTTTLTADKSGNGNNWTANNISLTSGATYDSMIDTPTPVANVRGNFAVLNPIGPSRVDGGGAIAGARSGNLDGPNIGSGGWAMIGSTIAIPSGGGKFYFEGRVGATGQSMSIGVQRVNTTFAAPFIVGYTGDANGFSYDNSGLKWNNGSTSYGSSAVAGDIIGVAVDASGGTSSMEFYKNGVSMGVAFSGITGDLVPAFSSTAGAGILSINFGQRPFAYTPPSGFKALHTGNLPEPAIVDGGEYFNTVTYIGDGATSRTVTGVGFQPDFVWVKDRSAADDHCLQDVIRGFGNGKSLRSNTTDEETNAGGTFYGFISSVNSDGFVTGKGLDPVNGNRWVNHNTFAYVAWNWKANGAGVTNTAGSITSTVSANPTAGFSIVTYTGNGTGGATIGHGLGVAPSMVIVKSRQNKAQTESWPVYHKSNGATKYQFLNGTGAASTFNMWNNTEPTSSVFSVSTYSGVNYSTDTYVAYCFAEVPGYSRFGSYTGNGSTDGPMVFTGFRPAFVMVKRTDSTDSWAIFDSARDTYNAEDKLIRAESSNAEASMVSLVSNPFGDFLSNGFKIRNTSTIDNANGGTYIFMAFAEVPFKVALAR